MRLEYNRCSESMLPSAENNLRNADGSSSPGQGPAAYTSTSCKPGVARRVFSQAATCAPLASALLGTMLRSASTRRHRRTPRRISHQLEQRADVDTGRITLRQFWSVGPSRAPGAGAGPRCARCACPRAGAARRPGARICPRASRRPSPSPPPAVLSGGARGVEGSLGPRWNTLGS